METPGVNVFLSILPDLEAVHALLHFLLVSGTLQLSAPPSVDGET